MWGVCMAPLHAKGGRGACNVAPILVAPPILLHMCTSPDPCPNGGAAFSPPCLHGQGGAEAVVVAVIVLTVLFG